MKREMIDASDPRVTLIGHPAPAWLVNYADLMTELVCFFVVLYAMAAALNKDVVKAKKEVEKTMAEEKIQGEVKVNKEGMQITIEEKGENVFFESGSPELSPKMVEILAKIAPALKTLVKDHHDVIVEGHTDDLPIRTQRFASNWELSTARATSVVQHMIQQLNFPPSSMGAIGYGQYHPLVPNDSAEHRSMNRRVVFFVKNPAPGTTSNTKSKNEKNIAKENVVKTEEAPADSVSNNSPPAEETTASAEPSADQPSDQTGGAVQ